MPERGGRSAAGLRPPADHAPTTSPPPSHSYTARALGVELRTADVRSPTDFPTAISFLHAEGAEGVNILSSPLLFHFAEDLGALLLAHKLPAICEWPEMAASACLASYGTTLHE